MRAKLVSILLALWGGLALPSASAPARDLSFEDRVRAQEAIERVYYSHQVGATRPFEAVFPRPILEAKVRTYLKQSLALEKFWKTPVTAEMLRRETERMARESRMPERLRELYAALGDDSFLVQECLARPALASRLVRDFFAYDESIHAGGRREAERGGKRTVMTLVRAGRQQAGPHGRRDPERIVLAPDEFARWSARLPEKAGQAGDLIETPDRFVVPVVLERSPDEIRVAGFVTPKMDYETWWGRVARDLDETGVRPVAPVDAAALPGSLAAGPAASACSVPDTWDNASLDDLPEPRDLHTSVWTGSLMIVWGGRPLLSYSTNTGGRYDPATNTWSPVSRVGAPTARRAHTAVWTGSQMIVWGGNNYTDTGGRYDPGSDTWTPTSTINAPEGREGHSAVWTGSQMLVWGGIGRVPNTLLETRPLASGGRYDPATDTWIAISATNAPSARAGHTMAWTGSRMLVWGGGYCPPAFCDLPQTGGRYDPVTDTWASTSLTNAPSGRAGHSAIWTGTQWIIWSGIDPESQLLETGGRYDPVADEWTPTAGAPLGRVGHATVWTGRFMVTWGGLCGPPGGVVDVCDSGELYDPATDDWTPTSIASAPSARFNTDSVWTGELMIVWGGIDALGLQVNTGGRYDPAADTWTPTATTEAPEGRYDHTAIWTGNVMVVWGGSGLFAWLDSGSRYDPVLDLWSPTATMNAPFPRGFHSAVWTGERMLIWGGEGVLGHLSAGSLYDPSSDAWAPMSPTGAPSRRSWHTAVWTGSEMVVWGGYDGTGLVSTGGRYDPRLNSWSATSTMNAPSGRAEHAAVWTGSLMLVWGGADLPTGGRYDPATDTWTPIASLNTPQGRYSQSAVWTGSRMLVWGGYWCVDAECYATDSGGLYDPLGDTWSDTSTVNSPGARGEHSAVWTGREMLVWGPPDSGGRYDPPTDTWTPMSGSNTPLPRSSGQTAVWTGSFMLIWGGQATTTLDGSGGRYCACPGPVSNYLQDSDGDGFGDPDVVVPSCSQAPGYVLPGAGDCDDTDPAVHPGAAEVCNGRDDDCEGNVDEGGDLLCADASACTGDLCQGIAGCAHPPAPDGTACEDGDACSVGDACLAGTCRAGARRDADGDAHPDAACGGNDCDDTDALVWSSPAEVPRINVTTAAPATLSWSTLATAAGPGTVYDLVSGALTPQVVIDFGSATCLQSTTATFHVDARAGPASGQGLWYLVRGRNTCGNGTYGTSQEDTLVPPCP